ncbi:uracil phosphoribosyltransferase [Desulfurobacterium sp.]|uniref:uracil phosphoribosyltransferase n=1 Tax=Desulfurobacterium sp. TaxID=2004706 RepID=UPI00263682CF|nr:uracil phosphoribosyltransferase [Desulfurobacterium sp.]
MITEVKNDLASSLLSILRDKKSEGVSFRSAAEKLTFLLVERALSNLPSNKVVIDTPVESNAEVSVLNDEVVFVPILRAGLLMLHPAISIYEKGRIGFAGVYRNEETLKPNLYYFKVPVIKDAFYFILDPMLATGGTAVCVVEKLLKLGINPGKIKFISFVSAPEGIEKLKKFSGIEIFTASIDRCLNDKGYILPGLGDAGDRFCYTEGVEVVEDYGI